MGLAIISILIPLIVQLINACKDKKITTDELNDIKDKVDETKDKIKELTKEVDDDLH